MKRLDLPNNKYKKVIYEPDPTGYFVCKDTFAIVNKKMCQIYQGKSLNFNHDTADGSRYNPICEKCKKDIGKIKSVSLEKYDELSEKLQDFIISTPVKGTVQKRQFFESGFRSLFAKS